MASLLIAEFMQEMALAITFLDLVLIAYVRT
jgi:hypothetical protein